MQSIVTKIGPVSFPPFMGHRIYMEKYTKGKMPPLELIRWEKTINQMMAYASDGVNAWVMVDQGYVRAGDLHRRGGLHIDMNLRYTQSGENWYTRFWPGPFIDGPNSVILAPHTILMASSHVGCRAFSGEWSGIMGKGGSCEGADLSQTEEVVMQPNTCYAGNVFMIHESVPVERDCHRTIVRIIIPS